MEDNQAVQFLESLLGRTLRVHATDTRMFVGTFKCTDAERNIILANTYEYRFPPAPAIRDAATSAAENDDQQDPKMTTTTTEPDTVKLDMTSRLIGLVVVPGQHITRIEVEETPEQARRREAMKR